MTHKKTYSTSPRGSDALLNHLKSQSNPIIPRNRKAYGAVSPKSLDIQAADQNLIFGRANSESLLLPFVKFDSNNSNISQSPNPKLTRRRTQNALSAEELVNRVSDFFDSNQVAKLLGELSNVKLKIRVLDLINQRREEIEKLELELKIEKFRPLIKRYLTGFRTRWRQKQKLVAQDLKIEEENRISLSVNNLKSMPHSRRSSMVLKSGKNSIAPKFSNLTISTSQHQLQTHSHRNSEHSSDGRTPNNYLTVTTPSNFAVVNNFSDAAKHHTGQSMNSINNTSRSPSLVNSPKMKVRVHPSEDTQRNQDEDTAKDVPIVRSFVMPTNLTGLLVKPHTNGEDIKQKVLNFARKKRELQRRTTYRVKTEGDDDHTLNAEKIFIASKKFETDIFKFLRDNQQKDSAKELIFGSKISPKTGINWIEDKAGERFERYKKDQIKHKYAPSTSSARLFNDTKQMSSLAENRFSHVTHATQRHSEYGDINGTVRSPRNRLPTIGSIPTLQNIINEDVARDAEQKKLKAANLPKKVYTDDDSLISYTESKLDYLYRISSEMRSNIKFTGKHIKASKTKLVQKKLEEIENQKMDKLQTYLNEIIFLNNKKLT